MTSKRAYKLQEFVAHSSSVTSVRLGKKSSRLLATGAEDHKVNLWTIGKPNCILSLSGHTSGISSVDFDQSEVKLAAGGASGTVKLWDLEEAKIVRTLNGHRSSCISLDFHPFGEFIASGSSDTNLKIWDMRKKGCIFTYKGHTGGVNAIRFTPDGRWIVSGGGDNTVKLWDLTAGKLLHEFKFHEGQIESIDFHPSEFLLATGSADRTVKFWDLETFELIGSTAAESTGVRCLKFNPDGRTLLCGFHDALKVFSWEPIRCRDSVDVAWSKVSDFIFHEGKLLACSYNQSFVGVWVVDIRDIITNLESTLSKTSLYTEKADKKSVPGHVAADSRTLIIPKKSNSDMAARTMPFSLRKSLFSRLVDLDYEKPDSHVIKGRKNSEEDPVVHILEPHEQFVSTMLSRLAKLQAVYRHWERRNMKGVISMMDKMADHAVSADVISALSERMDIVTLEICTSILPLLHTLLGSCSERHLNISMEMVLKLVRTFGSTIQSAWSISSPVGVDIEAEQRMERYKQCFVELAKIKETMPSLIITGAVAESAQELNLAIQGFCCN